MMRSLILTTGLLGAATAWAESPWLDPEKGCGRAANFAKTGHAADLPGCSGKLPKDAPQVEVVLHDAKNKLLDAEELLGKNKLEKLDALLTQVEGDLGKSPPVNPEIPDRWEQAQPIYKREVESLRNRRRLAPMVEKLRTSWTAAMEADKSRNKKELEGGPADAMKAADACTAAFAEVRTAKIEPSTEIELEKDKLRRVDEAQGDCERVHKSADGNQRAQVAAAKAKRAQWRKAVRGDRLKTFDAHATALPEFEGAADNWRAIAKVPVWKYPGPSGVEIYTFKANKLASRTVAKK
jgi:hypothetical protein